jgi:putative cell wall-binding protein
MHGKARKTARIVAMALAVAVALVPAAPAFAATRRITMSDLKTRGPLAVKALNSVHTATAAEMISGKVSLPGTWAADAIVSAVAFQNDGTGWGPVAGSDVATDGSYSIDLPGPGTFRVGFFDSALVYADAYYANASKVESGTDISVTTATPVANIDQTLTANPAIIVEGTVGFSGAPGSAVGIDVYSFDSVAGAWAPLFARSSADNGAYRIHLPKAGTYRLGFTDYNDVFSSAYYANASTVESATDISVVTTGIPVAGVDQTLTAQPSTRTAGANRFETAIALSQKSYPDGFGGTVTLANGNSFADSLAGSPYALAMDGPMLLTASDAVPASVMTEIARLNPMQVVILGGRGAVSLSQEIALRNAGVPIVRRIEGRDRYETATQIAKEMVNNGLAGETLNVCVASGAGFADAMAAAPLAAAEQRPFLFVTKDGIPAATQAFIDDNAPASSLVLGGTGVISDAVATQLPAVTRIGGSDRYDTAAKIAAYGIDTLGMNRRVVGLASGANFADGLAAGGTLGARREVLLLTPAAPLAPKTVEFLTARKADIARIALVGGTAAVSEATFQQALNALK